MSDPRCRDPRRILLRRSHQTGAILNPGRHTRLDVGPNNRAKNQALSGSLLQARLRFPDRRIFLQRDVKHVLQCDSVTWSYGTKYKNHYEELWHWELPPASMTAFWGAQAASPSFSAVCR